MYHSPARWVTTARAAASLVSLACVLALAGCGDDPPQRHLTRPIGPQDVLGVWQMTTASRELLKRDGYVETPDQPYSITFNNDGWFKFDSVVDDVKGGTYTKCIGTWRLDHDVVVENESRANVVALQLLRKNDRYYLKLSLTEDGGVLKLWNVYGEPKALEYIEYERPGVKKPGLFGE